eukprot:gene9029-11061_t
MAPLSTITTRHIDQLVLPQTLTDPFEDETDSDSSMDDDSLEGYSDGDDDNGSGNFEDDDDELNGDYTDDHSTTTTTSSSNTGKSSTTSTAEVQDKKKKPPNAFILFSQYKRRELKKENPQYSNAYISTLLGKKWMELHPEDKKKFVELSAKIRENSS